MPLGPGRALRGWIPALLLLLWVAGAEHRVRQALAAETHPGRRDASAAGEALDLSGRFSVGASWRDPRSAGTGPGRPVSLTVDTGAFWFFDPANLELVVKTLDGRTVNGHWWVFAAGLTDVEVELRVEDLGSGVARVYRNPPFGPPRLQDTVAFDPRLLEPTLTGRRVLWIGAHPDDEVLAAPWLASLCRDRGASCTLLVVTRGEAGSCALPAGCVPDLATVRAGEMASVASFLGAELVLWSLPDGSASDAAGVRRVWAESVGGKAALLELLAAEIRRLAPDWILTFDPRHGSTGHPDHRALGEWVEQVLALGGGVSEAPGLWRLASRAIFEDGTFAGLETPAIGAGQPPGRWLESVPRPSIVGFEVGLDSWDAVIETARRHPSQFSPAALDALREVPAARRRVLLDDSPRR